MSDLLTAAREALLAAHVVVPHTDADGLASGAMALRARGEGAEAAGFLERGEVPWGRGFGGTVALLDYGMRAEGPPGVIVDHHAPEAEPRADQVLVSGYGAEPEASTSILMKRVLPDAPAWLAAVGAVGDLGRDALSRPECAGVPKTAVTKLVPLINAPRRAADGPVRTALELLVEHDDPRDALRDPRIARLEEARRAWRAAFDTVVRTAPRVGERAAVIRFSTPFQVHPLVATTWARRLAPRPVIAANDDYLPGKVNFAIRGGSGDLRALLKDALPDVGGEFAHGHDRATGGSLSYENFERLTRALGVPA
jgi:single-stranded-DNA-specific exonuclease